MSDRRLTLGILVSGRGSNLAAIVAAIASGALPATVGVVLSSKKEAQALQKTGGAPAYFVDPAGYADRAEYDGALVNLLKAHGVDLVVLAGYMRWVTPTLIEPYRNRIINIHPSLLPAFPGLRAQRQALEHGAKITGCTVHFVDEKLDHGPIIAQTATPILEGDTEATLSERILHEEHKLLLSAMGHIAAGRLQINGRIVSIGGMS